MVPEPWGPYDLGQAQEIHNFLVLESTRGAPGTEIAGGRTTSPSMPSTLSTPNRAFERHSPLPPDNVPEPKASAGFIEEVIFPSDGELRIRKVVKRSNSRTTGKHPSPKNGRMMQFESFGELNVFLHLEWMPEVIRYHEQPCRIVYRDDAVRRVHYPDVLVEFAGRRELWEVKTRSEAQHSEILTRTALMQQLVQWGYGYRVVIAEDFKVQPRLRNIEKLLHFGYRAISMSQREEVRLWFTRQQSLSWEHACSGVCGDRGREAVSRLVLEGRLTFDVNEHWSASTQFSVRETL